MGKSPISPYVMDDARPMMLIADRHWIEGPLACLGDLNALNHLQTFSGDLEARKRGVAQAVSSS
jgi:hypothetical protein